VAVVGWRPIDRGEERNEMALRGFYCYMRPSFEELAIFVRSSRYHAVSASGAVRLDSRNGARPAASGACVEEFVVI
jgi:hypothetical protein